MKVVEENKISKNLVCDGDPILYSILYAPDIWEYSIGIIWGEHDIIDKNINDNIKDIICFLLNKHNYIYFLIYSYLLCN